MEHAARSQSSVKRILQFVSGTVVGCSALFSIAISTVGAAQSTAAPALQIAIWPQHDVFTFEIGRALHAELSKRTNVGFELINQRRVEQFVNIPCICDSAFPNDPSALHGEPWSVSDRKQGAIILRSSVYFALVADSAGGEWYVDLRVSDTRKRLGERSLGRSRYVDTKQIVARMTELIGADQEFNYVTAAAKSGGNLPADFAIVPQPDLFTIEIARVLNEQLTRAKSAKFFVVPQAQVEELLRSVAPDGNQLDTDFPLHQSTTRIRDRNELAYAVRSTSYFMLQTDTLDNHHLIDVWMFTNSDSRDSRSLGKVRYTNAKETGIRAAQLIAADTAFKRLLATGVKK